MNRRIFLSTVGTLPTLGISSEIRQIRSHFLVDNREEVQMILTAHHHADAAEKWRRGWAMRAFESQGEWYLQTSSARRLPRDLAELPGTLVHHTYVAGVAAAESSMLVGAFRRQHIACIFRVRDDEEVMIALAGFFAGQHVPAPFEVMWSPAQLQAFVPTNGDMGMDITPSDTFWP